MERDLLELDRTAGESAGLPARHSVSGEVAAALRAHLWQRPLAALAEWLQGAPVEMLSSAEALRALMPPASATGRAAARLSHLAVQLRGRTAYALRMQALQVAEQCGMDSGRARLLQFETMAEARIPAAATDLAAACLAMPSLPSGWRGTLRQGVVALLESAAGADRAEVARKVLQATGLHFLDEVTARLEPDDSGLVLAGLIAAGEPYRARTVQAVLALALQRRLPGARLLAGQIPPGSDEAVVASAVLAMAEQGDVAEAAARVGAIAMAGGATAQAMPLTLALVLALCGHPARAEAARQAARRPLPEPKAAELMAIAVPRPAGLRDFVDALAQAGCSPLSLLDAQGAAEVPVIPGVARLALGRLVMGAHLAPEEVLRTLQSMTQAEDQVGDLDGLMAEAARRHAPALMGLPQGPALLARVLTAVQDWQGSLAAWEKVSAQSRNPVGALARAYMAAARLRRTDLAHDYLDRLLAVAPQPDDDLALTLAHGACILGDLPLARRFLPDRTDLPQDDPRHMRGGLAWRLDAWLNGRIDRYPGLPPDPAHETAPPPRALVIDPGFAANAGHHLPYTAFATRFLAEELDVDAARIWACLRRDPPGLDNPDMGALRPSLHRLLDLNPYAFNEFPRSAETMANLARAVDADLAQALDGADLRQVQVLYWHSMKSASIGGFACWVARRFAGQAVTVIVGVIEVDYLNATPAEQALGRDVYGAGLRQLRDTPGVTLIVHAETAAACDEMAAAAGPAAAVHLLPYLPASRLSAAKPVRPAFAGREVTIGIVGGSRADRGLEMFPELMLALADVPDLRWEVQVTRSHLELMDPVLASYMDWAVRQGLCRWHDGVLSAQDYASAMRRLDIVLLPYRNRYAVSGSGVFFESLDLGRFVVVPDKTAMHDLLRRWDLPCATLPATTVGAAERVLRDLLRRRPQLRATMADPARIAAGRPGVADLRRLLHAGLAPRPV